MKQKSELMTKGPLLKNIILYTIPIILTNALQLLFHAADLAVVGQFCGSLSVGAVGATTYITNLFINLFIGVSMGVGIAVAQAYGAKNTEDIKRTVHTAIPTALVCSGVVTGIGIATAEPMLKAMDTPETLMPLATLYLQIYFSGIIFNMLYNFSAAILRAVGDTKSPLTYLTISGVLNVVLNVIFVTLLDMNVAGVALATTISQAVSAGLTLRALMCRTDHSKLSLKHMRIYKAQLIKIITIGLPAGLSSVLFNIANVVIQSSINLFGEAMIAGSAAGNSLLGFVGVLNNGFSQSAMNFVGQNVGARQFRNVQKATYICLAASALSTLVVSMLVIAFGPQLLSIYISDSADAIAYGVMYLSITCSTYMLAALLNTASAAIRGMGASTVTMIITLLGACGIRILWVYTIFQRFSTPQCLLWSFPVTWAITFTALMVAFFIVLKKVKLQAEISA